MRELSHDYAAGYFGAPSVPCPGLPGWSDIDALGGNRHHGLHNGEHEPLTKCYRLLPQNTSDACHAHCEVLGGRQACIENQDENDAVAWYLQEEPGRVCGSYGKRPAGSRKCTPAAPPETSHHAADFARTVRLQDRTTQRAVASSRTGPRRMANFETRGGGGRDVSRRSLPGTWATLTARHVPMARSVAARGHPSARQSRIAAPTTAAGMTRTATIWPPASARRPSPRHHQRHRGRRRRRRRRRPSRRPGSRGSWKTPRWSSPPRAAAFSAWCSSAPRASCELSSDAQRRSALIPRSQWGRPHSRLRPRSRPKEGARMTLLREIRNTSPWSRSRLRSAVVVGLRARFVARPRQGRKERDDCHCGE